MTVDTSISVVIPTFNRGEVLLNTVDFLLKQDVCADEIILVDQTPYQETEPVFAALSELAGLNRIVWTRLPHPSIPAAMNHGLQIAQNTYVLFLDDDIEIDQAFVQNHKASIAKHNSIAHVGQIIQPWNSAESIKDYIPGSGLICDLEFPFNQDKPAQISNCMAGNLCVRRLDAIEAGGFDEKFGGSAYRFETEFCRRLIRHTGRKFRFEPEVSIRHLHVDSGGTRATGDFLRSIKPAHSMGDYYFALLESRGTERWSYIGKRLFKSVMARFYLSRPWYAPIRLLAEIRGLIAALRAHRTGQQLIGAAPQFSRST